MTSPDPAVPAPSAPPAAPPPPAVSPLAATVSAPPPAARPAMNLKGTMIGMAPPELAPQAAPAPAEPANTSPSQPPRQFAGTMIGMAPPTFSPAPSPPPPPPAAAAAPPAAPAWSASDKKTVLGVARPGIAPLNPGQAKPVVAAVPAPALAPGPHDYAAPPSGAVGPGLPAYPAPPVAPPARISFGAALAIIGSAMLLVMAGLAFFMLRGRGSVAAKASLDSSGAEMLELSCSECPDGTKTWTDGAPVAFQGGKAKLRLQTPLKVGENPLVLVLERPGRSREEIALSIPIEYRVRSSADGLSEDVPKVSVLVSALPGTAMELDGKPVTLDASGAARIDYDVTAALLGPEASVKVLERSLPYKATTDGRAQIGEVSLRVGITPLIVDAPGMSITVGAKEIVVAGRTAPGAALKVGATPVTLDAEGRFVSKQALSAGDNKLIVRATLKDHAPRIIELSARRSDDLEREAALARSMAQASYADVLKSGDAAVGQSIALEGQVYDLRHDGYTSVLLVDVKKGCKKPPCLAKLLYGVETQLDKGKELRAFGKLVRFVDGPRTGQRIPEVRAQLVVAGAP